MVEQRYGAVLNQILELLDTACQASLELLEQYSSGEAASAVQLLGDLRAVIRVVRTAQEPLLPQLEHAYTVEMLGNVEDTLNDIQRSMETGNRERAAMKIEFQLFPFLRQLKEAFYFWGTVYPDKERMDRYYQEEFAPHYQNYYVRDGEPAQYRLSIVVPAYNHLEITKQCISQLLKETDFEKLNAELILIDHGSTDGTLEFFEGLGAGKVIRFQNNVRMYMFTTFFQLCQGEYVAFISNDILVTKNWAEILLNCLESDPKIIAAAPATPNIFNHQAVGLPDLSPDEFVVWAGKQNRPDPSRWNDRVRLMPPLGMYRTSTVNTLGFADPSFYSMEFWDDDFSFRARRAGYRQLVCNDVACYHFGRVTGIETQVKENTLAYGRELFKEKNGVDAWGNGFCYDPKSIQLLLEALPSQGRVSILGLDCGAGDTPLQVKNELRRKNQECKIYQMTGQRSNLADITPHSEQAYFAPDLVDGLCENFDGAAFDCAVLGRGMEHYEDIPQILASVSQILAPGGLFVFFCENPFFAPTIEALLHFSMPEDSERYILVDPEQIRREAVKHFSQVKPIGLVQDVKGLEQFAAKHFRIGDDPLTVDPRLKINRCYFVCKKSSRESRVKVTVVTQAYNSKDYIRRSIESVLNQTYTNLEYIIYDNGSTDGTSQILEEYAKKDSRIKLLRGEKNYRGIKWCEILLKEGTGKYFAELDSDDWIEPDYLDRLVDLAEIGEFDLISTGTLFHYEEDPEQCRVRNCKEQIIFENKDLGKLFSLYYQFFITYWAKLVRMDVFRNTELVHALEQTGLGLYGVDVVICLALLRNCRRICVDNSVLHHYIYHKSSATFRFDPLQFYGAVYLFKYSTDFLRSYGPISQENFAEISRMYAENIFETMSNIDGTYTLSTQEKMAEYKNVLTHEITQQVYKNVDEKYKAEALYYMLRCASQLSDTINKDFEEIKAIFFPLCGKVLTHNNVPLFLAEDELFQALLHDDKLSLAANLRTLAAGQKCIGQFPLTEITNCLLQEGRP